jgi:hypothetical protein
MYLSIPFVVVLFLVDPAALKSTMLISVTNFVMVLLVETVPFKSDAVQKHTIITLIPM